MIYKKEISDKIIGPIHETQLLHYLKATGLKIGYIINFGKKERIQY